MKECAERQMEISDQEHNLKHDKNGKYIHPSEEKIEILKRFSDKWWDIERPLRASIVKCPICSKHNRDMTYHKKSKTWFCVEHYKTQIG